MAGKKMQQDKRDDVNQIKTLKTTHDEQIRLFKETARQLGADESEAAFDEKLKALTKQKPVDQKKS